MNMEQIIESTKHYIAALRKASAAKTRGEIRCSGRISSSCSTSAVVMLLLLQTLWLVMIKKRTVWIRV